MGHSTIASLGKENYFWYQDALIFQEMNSESSLSMYLCVCGRERVDGNYWGLFQA